MPRYPSRYSTSSSFSFGPGPVSSTLKTLIVANVVVFLAQAMIPQLTGVFGLQPILVVRGWFWQLATYMFLHGGLFHILFNMLALWMFGSELERLWGTRYFLRFYFATGIGAGLLTVLFSFLPFDAARQVYYSNVIGASGAIYGLLLAYGLYFPDRPIYMYLVFPIPARYFVLIMGAIAFYLSLSDEEAAWRTRRTLAAWLSRTCSSGARTCILWPKRSTATGNGSSTARAGSSTSTRVDARRTGTGASIDRCYGIGEYIGACSLPRAAQLPKSSSACPSQSWRIGLKTSSSNVSSRASAWCSTEAGMCSTSPSRTVISSPPTRNRSAP